MAAADELAADAGVGFRSPSRGTCRSSLLCRRVTSKHNVPALISRQAIYELSIAGKINHSSLRFSHKNIIHSLLRIHSQSNDININSVYLIVEPGIRHDQYFENKRICLNDEIYF